MKKTGLSPSQEKIKQALGAAALLPELERLSFLEQQAKQKPIEFDIAFAPTAGSAAIKIADQYRLLEQTKGVLADQFRKAQMTYLRIAAEQAAYCTWNPIKEKPATVKNQNHALKLVENLLTQETGG